MYEFGCKSQVQIHSSGFIKGKREEEQRIVGDSINLV